MDERMTRAELHKETGCTSDCRRNGCPDELDTNYYNYSAMRNPDDFEKEYKIDWKFSGDIKVTPNTGNPLYTTEAINAAMKTLSMKTLSIPNTLPYSEEVFGKSFAPEKKMCEYHAVATDTHEAGYKDYCSRCEALQHE